MATLAQWVQGARPRTLPASVAPVVAGTGLAAHLGHLDVPRALAAAVVALALQVGVNYANDYSDGIRGTDATRVGPVRLVGQRLASAPAVRRVAFIAFGVAGVAGLVLAVLTSWWLLVVGASAILAAWLYTGGPRPYGYVGLGELFVFVYFGLVATVGTVFVEARALTAASWLVGAALGLATSAILTVNNLRDRDGDAVAGKHTLAVRLGERSTRWFFALEVLAAGVLAAVAAWMATGRPLAAGLVLAAGALVAPAALGPVLRGATGRALIAALAASGRYVLALGVVVGVVVAAL